MGILGNRLLGPVVLPDRLRLPELCAEHKWVIFEPKAANVIPAPWCSNAFFRFPLDNIYIKLLHKDE